ncbi:hypothetical protein DIE15_08430 [Burkholderia sp. Bp9031]|nr:hypothetical protein DIE15_08430 [Burkholderia sp. Bp9031]
MSVDPGDGSLLDLTIRYNTIGDHWELDVRERDNDAAVVEAVPLVLGLPILWRDSVAFFFWLEDLSGVGIDPIGGNDFGERFALYVGMKAEVSGAAPP